LRDRDINYINSNSDSSQQKAPAETIPNSNKDTTNTLSKEQLLAVNLITQGRNVFVTGVAGTGKSLVLKKALEYVQEHYEPREYVAVAPTGATAVALEGQTMHSFAGIGIPKIYKDFRKMKTKKNNKKKWMDLKVLILDEVSMISGEFFDSLSKMVSEIRDDPRPFGGIQLIVCGDFLQLSPIPPRQWEVDQTVRALQEKEGLETPEEARDLLFLNRGFCFQSIAWKEADFEVVELKHVFRQSNQDFVRVLQDIRVGEVTPETVRYLKENCERPLPPNDLGIQPTILHSKNVDVTRENLVDLNKLSGDAVTYEALDEVEREKGVGPWVKKDLENNSFFKSCLAEHELQLKIGAQVMLIKNLNTNSRLVNGSRGTVVGFRKVKNSSSSSLGLNLLPGVSNYPVVLFKNGMQQVITPQKFQSRILGKGTCTRTAIPLKLAWAITAHKAQGLTMDYVIADVGAVFAEAQLYVALSRASDASGLELRNFSRNRVRANALALRFHQNPKQQYPFWCDGAGSKPTIMIESQSPTKKTRKKKNNASKIMVTKFQNEDADENLRSLVATTQRETSSKVDIETRPKSARNSENHDHRESPKPLSQYNLKKLKVVELKDMLREYCLKVSGNKAELIERLMTMMDPVTTTSIGSKTEVKTRPEIGPNSRTTNASSSTSLFLDQALMSQTVVELKATLREYGLKVSGRKAELIERLLTANARLASKPDVGTRPETGSSSSRTHAKSSTPSDLDQRLMSQTVVELKSTLREHGLKVSGRKADLIQRLIEANEFLFIFLLILCLE